jgi:hypothetical protein
MTAIQELINDARAEFAQAAQKMRQARRLIEAAAAGTFGDAAALLAEVDAHTQAGEALIERAAKALDVPRRWE